MDWGEANGVSSLLTLIFFRFAKRWFEILSEETIRKAPEYFYQKQKFRIKFTPFIGPLIGINISQLKLISCKPNYFRPTYLVDEG